MSVIEPARIPYKKKFPDVIHALASNKVTTTDPMEAICSDAGFIAFSDHIRYIRIYLLIQLGRYILDQG